MGVKLQFSKVNLFSGQLGALGTEIGLIIGCIEEN
jgi:hypothetical protein